jgi:hypothetical protein
MVGALMTAVCATSIYFRQRGGTTMKTNAAPAILPVDIAIVALLSMLNSAFRICGLYFLRSPQQIRRGAQRFTFRILSPALLVFFLGHPACADSFDGKWSVTVAGISDTCRGFPVSLDVVGANLSVTLAFPRGGQQIKTAVSPDGLFTADNGHFLAKGKFAGAKIDLSVTAECGVRVGTGSRDSGLAQASYDGVYKGVLSGGSSCFGPTANFEVTITGATASGNWSFPPRGPIGFLGKMAKDGFTANRVNPTGEVQDITGTLVENGAALEARVRGGGCVLLGTARKN